MAAFDFKPAFDRTQNPEIKQLQDTIRTLTQKLSIVLRDIGEDNLSPELLASLQTATNAGEVQVIKGKTANAYVGNDGVIYKILSD